MSQFPITLNIFFSLFVETSIGGNEEIQSSLH